MKIDSLIATDRATDLIARKLVTWAWLPPLAAEDGSDHAFWQRGQSQPHGWNASIAFHILVATTPQPAQPSIPALMLYFTPALSGEGAGGLVAYLATLAERENDEANYFFTCGDDDDDQ